MKHPFAQLVPNCDGNMQRFSLDALLLTRHVKLFYLAGEALVA
jgi:hypothetical protein